MAARDIFGIDGPTYQEQLEADPELRARVDKQRARLAKQPSAGDVIRRRNRKLSESLARLRAAGKLPPE